MWVMKDFQVENRALVEAFVRDNGLATLVSRGSDYPVATHIPLEWETTADGVPLLRGHMAKANPHWHDFAAHAQVLAIFQSPVQHYISSSWYDHPNAPTWNYLSVHIVGNISIIEGQALWDSVSRLTDRYEQQFARRPVALDTLPAAVQKQMQGIVGFEITLDHVQASFKMSQNRHATDYQSIIQELQALQTPGARLMADAMISMRQAPQCPVGH
ncbi:FMN-binding negative transcriptional regulator [Hymenobacter sp. BT664]|uniref:FMN-binding negative transcriptional regulator n=1 Tax=Hymenobacter montanus TaxID=2771359 RepID=A0A927BD86_9BACT|nr:FMN-binding negative transcriptional regulator [Hymenobacter montanus]MBD2768680.1 FMN-binding negative transcriptional regulator [Hymenobacter montanus]